MKLNYEGCAICDSTWGNVWAEVAGERRFFCCDLCVVQFRTLLDRVQRETGWEELDSLTIRGDRRGRTCEVSRGSARATFAFAFNPDGSLRRFGPMPPEAAVPSGPA